MNKSGPIIDPWDIPEVTLHLKEWEPLATTC